MIAPGVSWARRQGLIDIQQRRGRPVVVSLVFDRRPMAREHGAQDAKDGERALELARREKPDLVLLDVMMPRMSGFEVCQKLKSNPDTRDIVVIMVTALHEVADYERAVESGTDDFLSKPVNKLELLTRVRSLLRVALLRRRLDELGSSGG